MVAEPDKPRDPLHPSEALQLLAFEVTQLKVAVSPRSMLTGDADRLTAGAGVGAVTETFTMSLVVPPAPVQVRL
jgi:hypothetical protein